MSSLGSILSIATSALRTSQAAVGITAHNVANAETEGYSRQRPVITEGPPLTTADGNFGTGVRLRNVERVRDELTNAAVRRETALSGEFSSRTTFLRRVEGLLGEPGDQGLSYALDAFFSGWSELSANPTSGPARAVLQGRAELLTDAFRTVADGLDRIRQDVEARLGASVDRINTLGEQIAGVNREIVAFETGGRTAGDLRDARDRMLDELATLTPITVTLRENGAVGVLTGGISLVDGAGFGAVELRSGGGTLSLGLVGRPGALPDAGGSTGGLLEILNRELTGTREALDRLVSTIIEDVNTLHRSGTAPDGATGLDFFDPVGNSASSFRLSDAIRASPASIAAAVADGAGDPRPGANEIALAIAGLRDQANGVLGETPGGAVQRLVSRVGMSLRSSMEREAVHRTLADRAELERASISGVSMDEEMTRLLRFQAAYSAAARVVSAADEMMETILRM